MCKFQAQRTFTWGGVLENNINYILRSHLTASAIGLRWFFDKEHTGYSILSMMMLQDLTVCLPYFVSSQYFEYSLCWIKQTPFNTARRRSLSSEIPFLYWSCMANKTEIEVHLVNCRRIVMEHFYSFTPLLSVGFDPIITLVSIIVMILCAPYWTDHYLFHVTTNNV
jgi:hypothetical protein